MAERLANGVDVKHWFYGEAKADNPDHRRWFAGLLHTYIRQYETGISCLLDDRIQKVREVYQKLIA